MRPRWYNDHELLAAVARAIHHQRARRYPDLVRADKLDRRLALDGLRIARTIAHSWAAIAALRPEPAWIHSPDDGGAWPYERRASLAIAARHARAAADADPDCSRTVGFADAVDTLIWWETAEHSARFYADFNIMARDRTAERAARSYPTPLGIAA